jgi:hypothetical protein
MRMPEEHARNEQADIGYHTVSCLVGDVSKQ